MFDNSTVQKVASKQIEIDLLASPTSYDLALRDSYMDMLDEPNSQILLDYREWNIWKSPDLWNRRSQDANTVHENPVYSATNANYVYSRVRNIGCAPSPADSSVLLRLYWSKASTGENWDADWTTTNLIGSSGLAVAGGREITASPNAPIYIPEIEPGDEFISSLPWYPLNPIEYDSSLNSVELCFLARVEELSEPLHGMASPELVAVKKNILNNNNIATHNFILSNFKSAPVQRHQILVGNADTISPAAFDLELIDERSINPHFSGDISSVGTVTVFLEDVYDLWVAGGTQGNYASINEAEKSVSYDGTSPLALENISFDTSERLPIYIEFAGNGISSDIPFQMHLRQFEHGENREKTVPYGNVSFELKTDTKKSRALEEKEEQSLVSGDYRLYPNPASDILRIEYMGKEEQKQLSLRVYGLSGKLLYEQEQVVLNQGQSFELDIQNYPQGFYILQFSNKQGVLETMKFIKQ